MNARFVILGWMVAALPCNAIAVEMVWTNGTSGSWNVATNWSPNQVPGQADAAIITNAGVTVSLSGPVAAGSIFIDTGSSLLLGGQALELNGPLTVGPYGTFLLDSGELVGETNAVLNGTVGWIGGSLGGTLSLGSNCTLSIDTIAVSLGGCMLNNYGTVRWLGGVLQAGDGTLINNFGLWEMLTDAAMDDSLGGDAEFDNYGVLLKAGWEGSSTFLNVAFYQLAGTIDVLDGLELNFEGGGGFYGGDVATNDGGLVVFSSGYFNFSGTVTSSNTWEEGGLLLGNNVILGTLNWASGSWTGADSVTIASNATLVVAGGNGTNDLSYCNITNYGTVNWASGTVLAGNGSYICNYGLWEMSSDQVLRGGVNSNATVFGNCGTLLKSGGQGGATSFQGVFNQLGGEIDVLEGEVDFQGGGAFTGGRIATNTPGRAVLSAGLFTLDGTVTGTNTWEEAGGLTGTNLLVGALTWVGGSWSGASSVTVGLGATLVVAGGAASNDFSGCLVTNNGTVAWTSGTLQGGNGANIVNNGVWEMQGDAVLNGAGTVFNNAGIARKTGGTNTTTMGVPLLNEGGAVEVDQGALSLNAGSYQQGGGTLTLTLAGSDQSQGGQLIATSATLGGPLNVELANGYVPAIGDQHRLLSCSNLSGTFTSVNLPQGFSVIYANDGALLIATNLLTGPVLNWPTPSPITFGTALGPGQLNAQASAAGSFAYSPAAGTVLGAGLHEISVLYTPQDASFGPITCTVSLLVEPALLTIQAKNFYMSLGSSVPALVASYTGFVNGDTQAALQGAPALYTSATSESPTGTYPITVSLGSINDSNYIYRFVAGKITIEQTDFYVATNGSDSNPGSLAQPFLTVGAAVLAEEAAGTNLHRNILFRGGEYFNVCQFLEGPGTFGADDSDVTFAGYSNETAVLYGGQPLINWVATSNGWWQAALPPYPSTLDNDVNELTNWEVRMLLVDGQMAARAQFPTDGSSLYYTNTGGRQLINYNGGDIPATMVATNMEVMVDFSWDAQTLGVASIAPDTQSIVFSGKGARSDRGLDYTGVQTYRVYNTAEGMSRPGQFYFDRSNQIVNYWPLNGKDPNTSEIIVPTTDCMFEIYGYPGDSSRNITFSNLTLKVNAVDIENEGDFGFLWDYFSLIHVSYCSNLALRNMTMGWCGGNAIGGDYGFCTNATLLDSEIGFCGGYGAALRMAPCVISNNFIHDTGLISWQSPAVRVSQKGLVIQNNIFNSRETAVGDHDMVDCTITLNNISNAMTVERDMGAFYCYFGGTADAQASGNLVASNVFQNVGLKDAGDDTDLRDEYQPAVYFDEYTSNSTVQGNVFINCKIPFFCNIATSNAVLNNICVCTNAQYLRIYASANSSPPNLMWGNVFYSSTNIVVDNPGVWDSWAGNLFWSACNPPMTNAVPDNALIADPRFAGPSFGFGSGSPALAMGMAPMVWEALDRGVLFNPAAPTLWSVSALSAAGRIQIVFQLACQPGAPLDLEVSTNLAAWSLVTNYLPTSSVLSITNVETNVAGNSCQFWRAVRVR